MKLALLLLHLLFIPCIVNAEIKLVTLDYPPYIVKDNDHLDGIAIRLIRRVFTQIDTPFQIKLLPFGRAMNYVKKGKADAIFTAFKTPQREIFADYNNEVLFEQNIRIIRKDVNGVRWDKSNISDSSICVVSNVSYGTWLDSMVASNQFKEVSEVIAAEQCLMMLLSGRVDFWVSNEFGAKYIAAKKNVTHKIFFEHPPIDSTPSYIAFSKKGQHENLIKKIDRTINIMKKEGIYQKIIDDYFNELEEINVILKKQ